MTPLHLNIINKGIPVSEVNVTNFLGLTIDSNLNWKGHISYNNSKISKCCYALSIVTNVSNKQTAINAYYGLVYPHLCYGIIFWGNSVDVQLTFVLQKRCIRSIFKLLSTDSLRTVFKQNNLLTLTGIYILEICLFVKNNKQYFFNTASSRAASQRSKYKHNICIPQSNNTMYHNSPYINAINIYNHLPLEFKLLEGKTFKKHVKDWLITKVFYNVNEYYS